MGVFKSIDDVLNKDIQTVLDSAESPDIIIKLMINEIEESLDQVSLELAKTVSTKKTLLHKIEKAKTQAAIWEQKAAQALKEEQDNIAKAALERNSAELNNIRDIEVLYLKVKDNATNMEEKFKVLKEKLNQARIQDENLTNADRAITIADSHSGLGNFPFSKADRKKIVFHSFSKLHQPGAFQVFDKYDEKIHKFDKKAKENAKLSTSDKFKNTNFNHLENNSSIEAQLLELKKKMGIID